MIGRRASKLIEIWLFILFTSLCRCSSADSVEQHCKISTAAVRTPVPVFHQLNQHGLLANSSTFTLNGTRNYPILSGAIHYFRVPHQYWRDRLERLRALGANTVETYVAWNLHEPSPGNVDFKDDLDIRQFLQTAQAVGLNVILRPGPYICAELDFGGLPSWLLCDANMKVRTTYAPFIQAVDAWFSKLFLQIRDLQFTFGGPIIAMQVENEYGSFGRDFEYVKLIGKMFLKHGATELLYCADGASYAGRIPGMMEALDGQVYMASALARLRKLQPDMPLMVAEFWPGWFDRWGEPGHHMWPVDFYAAELSSILFGKNPASVNFYMAHGGTNFGFMAGANMELTGDKTTWKYNTVTTSYDYDALIAEDGSLHPTKYNATRKLLGRVLRLPLAQLPTIPPPPVRRAYGSVTPNGYLPLYPESEWSSSTKIFKSLLDFVANFRPSSDILPMELLSNVNNGAGQQYGYILYRRDLSDIVKSVNSSYTLIINGGVRDRLTVVYTGVQQDTAFPKIMSLYQDSPVSITLKNIDTNNQILNILVENRGRLSIQFFWWPRDHLNNQRKGLQGEVELLESADGETTKFHVLNSGWDIYSLDFTRDFMRVLLDNKNSVAFRPVVNLSQQSFPAILRYMVDIGAPKNVADSFLFLPATTVITKGVAFVNGRNLGRFWNVGPQKSLYIPKWYWNYGTGGKNSIMIFAEETHEAAEILSLGHANDFAIELRDTPDLGPVSLWYGAFTQ